MKNLFLTMILSIFLPGVGHLYLGEFLRGVLIILGFIGIGIVSSEYSWITFLGIILYVSTLFSAYRHTKMINNSVKSRS